MKTPPENPRPSPDRGPAHRPHLVRKGRLVGSLVFMAFFIAIWAAVFLMAR